MALVTNCFTLPLQLQLARISEVSNVTRFVLSRTALPSLQPSNSPSALPSLESTNVNIYEITPTSQVHVVMVGDQKRRLTTMSTPMMMSTLSLPSLSLNLYGVAVPVIPLHFYLRAFCLHQACQIQSESFLVQKIHAFVESKPLDT